MDPDSATQAVAETVPAALGFRVKSGCAAAVLVAGLAADPSVIERGEVHLASPDIPETTHPFHSTTGEPEEDEAKILERLAVITGTSARSISDLIRAYHARGFEVLAAGIDARSSTDPASITNPYLRAHALERRLFDSVLEQTLRSQGVHLVRIDFGKAASRLPYIWDRPQEEANQTLMRQTLTGHWPREAKAATIAGWEALKSVTAGTQSTEPWPQGLFLSGCSPGALLRAARAIFHAR